MGSPRSIPPIFLAHGSPMLAVDGGAWGARWQALGKELAPIRGVLVCSAHWESEGAFRVTLADHPDTLHDFGGFPEALHSMAYPAPGDPILAGRVSDLLTARGEQVLGDPDRGLDHGAWVPLRYLFPEARVPVVQLSLPRPRNPRRLWEAGRALAPLRDAGILVLGSGGLVHNLHRLDWTDTTRPEPWAEAFEAWILEQLSAPDPEGALDWGRAPGAALAVPSTEHLDPLWLVLGAASGGRMRTLFEGWQLGSLSLRSLAFG